MGRLTNCWLITPARPACIENAGLPVGPGAGTGAPARILPAGQDAMPKAAKGERRQPLHLQAREGCGAAR
ncbi:hypothetical protein A9D60_06870 [Leisingera sp. JC1]|nr:hypothetical protein A9D60_06870 [Leisingera sp. JC1]